MVLSLRRVVAGARAGWGVAGERALTLPPSQARRVVLSMRPTSMARTSQQLAGISMSSEHFSSVALVVVMRTGWRWLREI